MKKLFALVSAALLSLGFTAFCETKAAADDYTNHAWLSIDNDGDGVNDTNFEFYVDYENNTAKITYVSTDLSTLTIPETLSYEYYDYDTYNYITKAAVVKEIDIGTESNSLSYSEVEIPWTVTSINDYAFGYYEDYIWQEDLGCYEWGMVKADDFSIICTENTAGHAYAEENGFGYTAYKNIGDAVCDLTESGFTYNGKAQKPKVNAVYGETVLTEGTDYVLSYENNVNAGKAVFTLTGTGDFRGEYKGSFTILPKDAGKAVISAATTRNYTGSQIRPYLTITLDGKTLVQNKDFKTVYASNINPGNATATVTFCGNYTGKQVFRFKIVVATVTNLKLSASTASALKLTWNPVVCDEYYVYRYNRDTKKYDLIAKTKSTAYVDKNLSEFTKYYYKVRGVKHLSTGDSYGALASRTCLTRLKTPNLNIATKNASVKLVWSQNPRATGYEIYRSTDGYSYYDWWTGETYTNYGTFKGLRNITGAANNTYTNTGLNNEATYCYKVRSYRVFEGVKYYSAFSTIRVSSDYSSILNAANLTPHASFKVYNRQKKTTTSYTYKLSSKDITILQNFAKTHFTANMTREQKLRITLNWINKNVTYATGSNWNQISGKSWVDAIFTYRKGQCAQYNGAMAAMMAYLGYDVNVVQGYRGTWNTNYWQHFWCEVNIGGITYIMETGNYGKNGDWSYFLARYSQTSGYIRNQKNM